MEKTNVLKVVGGSAAYTNPGKMKNQNFNQIFQSIGGFCLISAGIFTVVALGVSSESMVPGIKLVNSWHPCNIWLLIAFSLSVPGVIGIFSFLKTEVSMLNTVAFVLGLMGCIWSVAVIAVQITGIQIFASHQKLELPLANINQVSDQLLGFQSLINVAVIVWVNGWVLIGMSLCRSKKLPSYIGYLLIGSVLSLTLVSLIVGPSMIHTIVFLIFGISWILIGNSIRKYEMPY